MLAFVILEEQDRRVRPSALFFSQEDAESYAASKGDDAVIHEFILEGEYVEGQPVFASFTSESDFGTFLLDGLFADRGAAQANAGANGKVTLLYPTGASELEQDGWIEPDAR